MSSAEIKRTASELQRLFAEARNKTIPFQLQKEMLEINKIFAEIDEHNRKRNQDWEEKILKEREQRIEREEYYNNRQEERKHDQLTFLAIIKCYEKFHDIDFGFVDKKRLTETTTKLLHNAIKDFLITRHQLTYRFYDKDFVTREEYFENECCSHASERRRSHISRNLYDVLCSDNRKKAEKELSTRRDIAFYLPYLQYIIRAKQ